MRSIAIACSVHSDWQDCTKRAMEPPPKFGDGGGAIEVQSGSYLGEDDIVRFEDRYGRA